MLNKKLITIISVFMAGALLVGCGSIIQQAGGADSYEQNSVVTQPGQDIIANGSDAEFGSDVVVDRGDLPALRTTETRYYNEKPKKIGAVEINQRQSGEYIETITPITPKRNALATDDGIDDVVPGVYRLDPGGRQYRGRNDMQIDFEAPEEVKENNFFMDVVEEPADEPVDEEEAELSEEIQNIMSEDGNAVILNAEP